MSARLTGANIAILATITMMLVAAAPSWAQSLPHFESRDGKHLFVVDGEPYLMLTAQANNSSNYPDMLDKVWPAVHDLGANTLQIPVAWEQVEPEEGRFDFSYLDTLIEEARENEIRLVLLWFATWKNTSPNYTPEWVKLDNERFPRLKKKDGTTSYALTPLSRETLEADKRAFVQMMEWLKRNDREQTVIMVQVQNEPGTYRSVRDYSDAAQAVFEDAVPQKLVDYLGVTTGTWPQVFGEDADEFFHAWHIASYIGEIAAAGRAVYDLPMYANAALKDPINDQGPESYASGGPTHNVIGIYKAAAPALDFVSPDIYMRDDVRYTAVLDHYARPDNPLFVSETGNAPDFARYFFDAFGRGAIGFAPFGTDYTGYANYPLGGKEVSPESLEPFAANYSLIAPFAGEWARLAFERQVWGAGRPDDNAPRVLDLGPWRATVEFDQWQFGEDAWWGDDVDGRDPAENAGILIADLGEDTYLVTGYDIRLRFEPAEALEGRGFLFASVEEVVWEDGEWRMIRRWNGDQTDYGLNFTDKRQILRVRLATYDEDIVDEGRAIAEEN